MSEDLLLAVNGVSFRYRRKADPVFDDVSMSCRAGSVTAMEGSNGSGKSTLLKLCAGVLAPSRGSISRAARVTYQPQGTSSLQPQLTVREHARLFGIALGASFGEAEAGVVTVLDRLSPGGSIDLSTRIGELSGGTQQKVNLALALLDTTADLVLLDEPYAGFDARSLEGLIGLFADMRARGKAVIVVNHLTDPRLELDQVVDLGGEQWM